MSPVKALLLVVLAVLFASCAVPLSPTLEIAPASRTLVTGERVQLTVTRRFQGGAVDDVTSRVTFVSSDKDVATILPGGVLVAGNERGSVFVRAIDPNSDATAVAAFTVVPARVEALDVIPSPALVMAPKTQRALAARARFSDGVTRDVTAHVQWSSTNEAAAIVGRTPADNGVVSTIAEGDAIIVARDAETGIEGRTTIFVRGAGPRVVAIVVSPNPFNVGIGGSIQLVAQGVLTDGTTTPVTSTVQWASSNEAVVRVDASGVATGVAPGDATITASRTEGATTIRGSAAAKVP